MKFLPASGAGIIFIFNQSFEISPLHCDVVGFLFEIGLDASKDSRAELNTVLTIHQDSGIIDIIKK
jgi:hypothetical protein